VVSKTQLLLPSILPLRFATLGSRIVTLMMLVVLLPDDENITVQGIN